MWPSPPPCCQTQPSAWFSAGRELTARHLWCNTPTRPYPRRRRRLHCWFLYRNVSPGSVTRKERKALSFFFLLHLLPGILYTGTWNSQCWLLWGNSSPFTKIAKIVLLWSVCLLGNFHWNHLGKLLLFIVSYNHCVSKGVLKVWAMFNKSV